MNDIDQMRADRNRTVDRLRKRRIILAQLNGVPTSLVDAAPIRQRLRELTALGFSLEAIAATYGTGTAAGMRLIVLGQHQRAERKFENLARLPVTLAVHPRVDDSSWVPTLGAQRRLRSLMRLGWRHEDVRELVGRSTHVLVGNSAPTKIRAIDWRLVDAAWRTLCATPGPSTKSRTRAERLGYLPPLAWDDIDDPHEIPNGVLIPAEIDATVPDRILAGDWRLRANQAERVEVIRRWTGSQNELERRTGWNVARDLKIAHGKAA